MSPAASAVRSSWSSSREPASSRRQGGGHSREDRRLVVRYLDANLPRITISIGVAAFPHSGDNPQAVMKAADEALIGPRTPGATGSSCRRRGQRSQAPLRRLRASRERLLSA